MGIILSFIAAIFWASSNIIDKIVITHHIERPGQIMIIISGLYTVIGGGILFFIQEPVRLTHMPILLACGALWTLMGYTYFIAISREEISRVVPLFAFIPAFTAMLGAIFLHEIFAFTTYLGIAGLIFGTFLILSRGSLASVFKNKSLSIMLLSSSSIAVYNILSKYVLDYYSYWTVFAWITLFTALIGWIIFFPHIKGVRENLKKGWDGTLLYVGSEIIAHFAALIYTAAIAVWYVTLASSIITVQYLFLFLFTILLAKWKPNLVPELLNRKIAAQKIIAILFIILGVVLIS
ncbi:MAG: EamA family transporter [Candidatus Nomurabacteria bacterium]|nr:MAG: EamA family transporter [Candidatus Nomurabacteria bacterium]